MPNAYAALHEESRSLAICVRNAAIWFQPKLPWTPPLVREIACEQIGPQRDNPNGFFLRGRHPVAARRPRTRHVHDVEPTTVAEVHILLGD
jgi:hypothetical protein